MADKIVAHIDLVVKSKETCTREDVIRDISSGQRRYYAAIRSPLFGEAGKVIGVFGTSIEITAEKEAERLKSERREFELQAQEKFRKNAEKVAHDIRSPLASLAILAKICAAAIPEKQRIALREATTAIGDIANNLVSTYKASDNDKSARNDEEQESVLLSPVLLQMLTEKKYQYHSHPVKFDHNFSPDGEFSWIKIQPTAFKRSISNIINNAVDAFEQRKGTVTLHLDADDHEVRVTIEDDGKGMGPETVQKIKDKISFTHGKADGHEIGLSQVRDTLQNNQGEWEIQSQPGAGTKITLAFPRTSKLNWIADTIQVNETDTVVILDDDRSIHIAWDLRFEKYLKEYSELKLKHFSVGQETVDFICTLDANEKQKVFLLSDYELLDQKLNGLDVIEMAQMSRSILVTSHYANKKVQQAATQIGTKILPKQLASDVPVHVGMGVNTDKLGDPDLRKMDAIFVDDEQYLLDGFKMLMFGKAVDTYQNPQEFLDKVDKYHRETKILLDQNFANYHKKGTDIAEQLNAMGFTRLYLLSGEQFSTLNIPKYVTGIRKTDLDALEAVLGE